MADIGTGTIGTILQGAGTSTTPTFSTATYPSTATGTGKILRADGTNWSASTSTFPNTSGTSGNVLTSDGTNFSSNSPVYPSGLNYATVSLTSAQIKALHATPIQIVAAPGAGKVICVVGPLYCKFIYGGTNVFVAGAAQIIKLYYGTANSIGSVLANAQLVGSASCYTTVAAQAFGGAVITNLENAPINAYNDVATEITGNAANNNTISISLMYYTVTL